MAMESWVPAFAEMTRMAGLHGVPTGQTMPPDPAMPPAPDYATLLDPEVRAFIDRTNEFYPPDAATLGIAEQRAVYDRMCAAFDAPRPAGVTSADRPLGGVPCRVYAAGSSDVTVIHAHGGGFVVGGLHSHDAICAEICAATGFRVVALGYRLAPEHHHPAAFEDCRAVTRAAATEFGGRLVLAGDSAGANLVAAVTHALRGEALGIAGQVLIYPGLGGDLDAGSYLTHAHAPMLTRADILFYAGIRYPGALRPDAPDPTSEPLCDTDFTGLPPTVCFSAECDPHCDDGPVYAARITAAGGEARAVVEPGLVHGYLRARHMSARARDSFARITAAIRDLGTRA